MRNVIAHTSLDDLVGQQAQAPAGMARWCVAAGQGGDFGALRTVNLDRTARARRILKTVQSRGVVAVAPGRHGVVVQIERGGNCAERLAAIQFEQGGGAFEGLDWKAAFGKQFLQPRAVGVGKG